MDDLVTKFQELPENAQMILAGAGALIGILLLVLIVVAILSGSKGSQESGSKSKNKVPKRLPIAPIPLMNDRENALYRVLLAAMNDFPGYEVHPKVATTAMLGAREDEDDKVAKEINKKMICDSHDFVIIDRARYPVAVIELDSGDSDEREEQARRSGLPIVRVKNPHLAPKEISERLRKIFV